MVRHILPLPENGSYEDPAVVLEDADLAERLLQLAYGSLRKRVARALIRTLGDFKSEKLIDIRDGKIRITAISLYQP